ncbi:hypothetical protein CKO25_09415 [Thiocapsa imhoffii]|uniref:Uncharacterized protein n=1 Tax=Thiocapsa imhoffii TaxID=382777 RepID=A0A9X0WHK9_9GAMM|nr:hypothetical protein [Thiocapsa imhoffii]
MSLLVILITRDILMSLKTSVRDYRTSVLFATPGVEQHLDIILLVKLLRVGIVMIPENSILIVQPSLIISMIKRFSRSLSIRIDPGWVR